MLIGKLAKRSDTLATTIRYYERIGLLNAPPRMACGYRDYTLEDLERLNFIRRGRALGFSLGNIRRLIDLDVQAGEVSAVVVGVLIEQRLTDVQAHAAALRHLERELRALRAACRRGVSYRGGITQAFVNLKLNSRADGVSSRAKGVIGR